MNEEKNEIAFVIACINEFARNNNLSIQDSFHYLHNFKGIDFLNEHYEIEHTLSWNDVMDDLMAVCKKNGGSI